ncbi:hypothetical protein TNCV_3189391 [Trichonephila clavipes]|nr:hypothetical protein TNCV_3189391 [Trichonephila clavipes]
MQNHIATAGWELLHHPPYSPDFAPMIHLFPALKKNLAGRCFGSNAEVKQAVKRFFLEEYETMTHALKASPLPHDSRYFVKKRANRLRDIIRSISYSSSSIPKSNPTAQQMYETVSDTDRLLP